MKLRRDQLGRDLRKICTRRFSSEEIRAFWEQLEAGQTAYQFAKMKGFDLKQSKGFKQVKINQFSSKRKKTEISYKKTLQEKHSQTHGRIICQGCGIVEGVDYIDPSHLVPRSKRPDLIDDQRNVHWHCRNKCHPLCEAGSYSQLDDGVEIIEYLKEVAPDFLMRKLNRRQKEAGT